MDKKEIIDFIENFKCRGGIENKQSIEAFFLEGNCYWFARILKCRFPQGKILYDVLHNHFLFYGGNTLDIKNNGIFDIRGDITEAYLSWVLDGTVVDWDLYHDETHRKRIWRDCIAFKEVE